jgi:hypothetical protein
MRTGSIAERAKQIVADVDRIFPLGPGPKAKLRAYISEALAEVERETLERAEEAASHACQEGYCAQAISKLFMESASDCDHRWHESTTTESGYRCSECGLDKYGKP